MCWHKDRFIENNSKVKTSCVNCGINMWFPKSKSGKYIYCGFECKKNDTKRRANDRSRTCETCNSIFIPRIYQIDNGIGKFCSVKCSEGKRVASAHTDEANRKRAESMKLRRIEFSKIGLEYAWYSGESNKLWMGGPKESIKRRTANGKNMITLRKYRNNNKAKYEAHRIINAAIKNNTIIRLNCEICGNEKTHAHHDDYAKPLDVRFLCPKHHCDWHMKNGEGLNGK